MQELDAAPAPSPNALALLMDMELPVSVSFGRSQLRLEELVRLGSGDLVDLSRAGDDPVELIVNGYVVAEADIVAINGNFGLKLRRIAGAGGRLSTSDMGLPGGPLRAAGSGARAI